nr:IS66 family insertion sequence element accessory protein TnpB [Sphingomonas sp. BT553]
MASGTKVYLAFKPVSKQKGFDGLTALASQVRGAAPYSGQLFPFRCKHCDHLKALYWDGSGMCLFAKRLRKGLVRMTSAGRRRHRTHRRAAGVAHRGHRLGGTPWHRLR